MAIEFYLSNIAITQEQDNLMLNGDMEVDSNWYHLGSGYHNDSLTNDPTFVYSGNYGRYFVSSGAGAAGTRLYTSEISLQVNTFYTLELFIYPVSGDRLSVLYVYDGGIGPINWLTQSLGMTLGQWNTVTFSFEVASQEAYSFYFQFSLNGEWCFDQCNIMYDSTSYIQGDVDIQIFPEYEFKNFKKQRRSDHRTQLGKLYSYMWSDHERFEIPLNYVSESNAQTINEWWENGDTVLLKINSNAAWEINTLEFMNKSSPFGKRQKPYETYYQGVIELESF